ncbi:MAG: protein O-GlcNAc transferase [Gammaproteobacteria bacterium]|jgi:protein O-GlcNAc transferase
MKVLRKLKHSLNASLARKQVSTGASAGECAKAILAGQARLGAGETALALEIFEKAVQWDPSAASAYVALGEALLIWDDIPQAEASFVKAINLAADPSEGLIGVAHCALSTGHTDKARTFLVRVHDFQPQHPIAARLLGDIEISSGNLSAASGWLDIAHNGAPQDSLVHMSTGNLRALEGLHDDAVASFQAAIARDPDNADAHANIGSVLSATNQHDAAIPWFEKALALRPDLELAQRNFARNLESAGLAERAREHYEAAYRLRPTPALRMRLAALIPMMPRRGEDVDTIRNDLQARLAELAREDLAMEDPASDIDRTAFYLAYHGRNDLALQKRFADLYLQVCPELAYCAEHCEPDFPSERSGRISIGFISRYFMNHTIGHLMRGIIAELDRTKFEVTVFTFARSPDAISELILANADRTVTLPMNLGAARDMVADEEMDVIYYPDLGMDPLTFCLAFARLAPVQCVSWGHPVTTGLSTIDYFVSSELLETEDAQTHYCETLVRLPSPPVYFYRPEAAPALPRADLGLREDVHIYLCPQSLFKLHPDFDQILVDLLRQDKKGHVVLLEGQRATWTSTISERITALGPEIIDRIIFLPRLPQDKFLGLLASADVILDPPHFGGGRTTFEALAAGIPVVTLPSKFMRGRPTLACYRQMDIDTCIASDADDYVRIATSLACDLTARQELSAKINERSDRLFCNSQVVRSLEDFLQQAVKDA